MSYVDKTIGAESGGNANARNPNSTATGAGQFIESTWLAMLAKQRPDITGSRDQLLALRSDPQLSRDMTDAYAVDNAGILRNAGLPVTDGTRYLAHFAGPQGAVGLLNADPATPAGAILGAAAVKANPFLEKMSASDVAAWADRKMGGRSAAPMSMAGPRPAASPAAPAVAAEAPGEAPANQPAFQLGGSGGPAPVDLNVLGATPQLTNLLTPRPKLFAIKTAPFSLRG